MLSIDKTEKILLSKLVLRKIATGRQKANYLPRDQLQKLLNILLNIKLKKLAWLPCLQIDIWAVYLAGWLTPWIRIFLGTLGSFSTRYEFPCIVQALNFDNDVHISTLPTLSLSQKNKIYNFKPIYYRFILILLYLLHLVFQMVFYFQVY